MARRQTLTSLQLAYAPKTRRKTVAAHGMVHFVASRGRRQTYLACDDEPVRRRVPDGHHAGVPTCLWCWQAVL